MREVINAKDKKPAITKEQLFKTCDKYFEQHDKEPSQQIIIALIGGSAGTVGPLLQEWKEKKENDEQAILLMPDHIRDGGMTIIATWWQSIQPTINDMIAAAQKLADEKVSTAQEKCKDVIADQVWLEKENGKLETTAVEYQQQIEALELQLAKSQSTYDKERTGKEKANVKLARVEGQRDTLKQLIAQYKT